MFSGTCQWSTLLTAKLLGRMRSIYFISILSMLKALDVVNGFFIPQAPLFVQQYPQHSAGKPSMIFGGGGKSSAKGGIVVKVLQKTSFKETEIILPGKTNLRKALLENKIDVYPLQGKLYNCGGGGSCGTCAVNVVDGAKNCSPKGPGEKKLLEKKPDSYRLSCCTMVSGPVKIQVKP